ncbi:MAG: hypothetical protein K0U84_21290 [Actinomycetia bacterium]|nr:hypothetical protein [Actinomycetes bacterium]
MQLPPHYRAGTVVGAVGPAGAVVLAGGVSGVCVPVCGPGGNDPTGLRPAAGVVGVGPGESVGAGVSPGEVGLVGVVGVVVYTGAAVRTFVRGTHV